MMKEINGGLDIPIKAINAESGYFLMVDISEAIPLIPKRFTESHEFEELKEGDVPVQKLQIFMPDGRIPNDLAFSRWIAMERGVVTMPGSIFYHPNSPYKNDNFVRVAICKGLDHS